MTTYPNRDDAESAMIRANKANKNLTVVVEGPENGEYTTMSIHDAIDNGFTYSWAV